MESKAETAASETGDERADGYRVRAERLGYRGIDIERYVDARSNGLTDGQARAEVMRLFQSELTL